jgi:hypothetical protein
MKKIFFLTIISLVTTSMIFAQNVQANKGKTGQKIVKASEEVANTTTETVQQAKVIAQNVKEIIRIFEPFKVNYKKETTVEIGDGAIQGSSTHTLEIGENGATQSDVQNTTQESDSSMPQSTDQNSGSNQENYVPQSTDQNIESNQGNSILEPPVPSGNYNSDGTANLGTQNHSIYGNYLDMKNGEILDNVTAPAISESVDLIFTATKWSTKTLYAFFSPYYAKNSTGAMKYNFGTKFKRNEKHPATNWTTVNESMVALTNLNELQFNKIQTSAQLEAYVKQVQNFKESIEVMDNIQGKVIAIKTQMDNRNCLGLLLISNQYGTVGENSYIKVKLKVLGSDLNGDGMPD